MENLFLLGVPVLKHIMVQADLSRCKGAIFYICCSVCNSSSYRSPVASGLWAGSLILQSHSIFRGGNLFNREKSSIAHSLSLSSFHYPDVTEILLKRT